MHEDARTLARDPLIDVVGRDLRKQESPGARPNRAFGPLVETSGYALQLGVTPHDLIESGVELLNVLGKRGGSESHNGHHQEKETVRRDRVHRAAKTAACWTCIHVSPADL